VNDGSFAGKWRAMEQTQPLVIEPGFVEKPDCGFL
jgi:hypothetical protein